MKKIVVFFAAVGVLSFSSLAWAAGKAPREPAGPAVSVDQTVRHALAYSPQLQQAQEVRQQAVHEVRRAEAGFYPTIGIWGGIGLGQTDDSTTRYSEEQRDVVGTGNAGALFSQNIWQGGATSALTRSREAALQAQTHMVMDNAVMLVFNAVTSHVDVLRRRELVRLADENVRQHKNILALVRTRFEQGIASSGEVDQVASRVARAEATLSAHRVGLSAALNNYTRITGQPVQQRMLPVPLPKVVYASVDTPRDDSIQYNARIKAELANVQAAMGEKDYSRAGFAPSVNLDAGPSYSDMGYKGQNHVLSWNAMLNMRWDLYSGGADEAAFKAAAAKVREKRKSLHGYMDLLDEEIRNTFTRTRELERQSRLYAEARQASRRSRENFFQQFQAGQRGLLDVLDAESEYFYASVEEKVSGGDSLIGQYRLLALSGRLPEVMGVPVENLGRSTEESEPLWSFTPSKSDAKESLKGNLVRSDIRP